MLGLLHALFNHMRFVSLMFSLCSFRFTVASKLAFKRKADDMSESPALSPSVTTTGEENVDSTVATPTADVVGTEANEEATEEDHATSGIVSADAETLEAPLVNGERDVGTETVEGSHTDDANDNIEEPNFKAKRRPMTVCADHLDGGHVDGDDENDVDEHTKEAIAASPLHPSSSTDFALPINEQDANQPMDTAIPTSVEDDASADDASADDASADPTTLTVHTSGVATTIDAINETHNITIDPTQRHPSRQEQDGEHARSEQSFAVLVNGNHTDSSVPLVVLPIEAACPLAAPPLPELANIPTEDADASQSIAVTQPATLAMLTNGEASVAAEAVRAEKEETLSTATTQSTSSSVTITAPPARKLVSLVSYYDDASEDDED
jgi:hypothetical protein